MWPFSWLAMFRKFFTKRSHNGEPDFDAQREEELLDDEEDDEDDEEAPQGQ
jgi:hypothetical protein